MENATLRIFSNQDRRSPFILERRIEILPQSGQRQAVSIELHNGKYVSINHEEGPEYSPQKTTHFSPALEKANNFLAYLEQLKPV